MTKEWSGGTRRPPSLPCFPRLADLMGLECSPRKGGGSEELNSRMLALKRGHIVTVYTGSGRRTVIVTRIWTTGTAEGRPRRQAEIDSLARRCFYQSGLTEKLFIRPSLSTQYPRASLWQGLPNCVLCGQMVATWCLQQASVTLVWAATLLSPEELNCPSSALVLVALAITLHQTTEYRSGRPRQ